MGELAFALGVAGAQPARPLPLAPGWTRAGAALDADFAAGRYFFGGRETFAEADFLAACGGTGSGTQLTIGPYAALTGETLPFAGFAPAGIAGAVEATTGATSASPQVLWQLDDNAEEAGSPVERNRLRLSWDTDGHLHLVASTDAGGGATATQADLDLGPFGPSSDFRVAFSAATGLFAASLNGAPAERQAGGRLAPSTVMRIGRGHVTGEEWAGTIGRLTLFPATRDAEELENLAGDAARAIVAWGDSLTAGSGSTGSSNGYVPQLAALFDPPRAVANEGVAGQNSTEIAGRSGARRARLSLGGGEAVRNLFPLSRNWFERLPENLVNNGVAIDLVGSGVDAEGQPFGDIRCHGTATAGYVDFAQQIYGASAGYAASGSLDWTATVDVELVGGTTANVTGLFISLIEGDSPGGYSTEHDAPVQLDGARHRVSVSASLAHPSCARPRS